MHASPRQSRRNLIVGIAMIAALMLSSIGGMISNRVVAQDESRIVVGLPELVQSFDYPYDWAIVSTWVHSNISDCLIWRDRETGSFIPWLAESYENTGPLVWALKLREGISFTNGEPFNATAAKYTIDRIIADPQALVHNQWTFISEVRIIDDYNIEIETANTEPAFPSKMAGTACNVVPPVYMEDVGSDGFNAAPIGLGAYKFVEYVRDDHVTLEANEDYWRGKPDIDEVVIRSIPEASTRVAELQQGGVDFITSVPAQDVARIQDDPNLMIDQFLTTSVMMIVLRAGPSEPMPEFDGVTSDPLIRQAIDLAIDRNALVELTGGTSVPTQTRVTPPTICSDPTLYNQAGEYNPDRARELMAEAGYNGETLTFHASLAFPMEKEVAEVISAMLQEVGFTVDLQVMDTSAFREQIYVPYQNQEVYLDALGNGFFDPWITVLSEQSDRRERSGWTGPDADRVDELSRAAASNMDPESRCEQYIEAQNLMLAANGGPLLPLYQLTDNLGLNARLSYTMAPDGFLWFGDATLNP